MNIERIYKQALVFVLNNRYRFIFTNKHVEKLSPSNSSIPEMCSFLDEAFENEKPKKKDIIELLDIYSSPFKNIRRLLRNNFINRRLRGQ